ncbi:MAG: phospholipase D-like domain-containing protein [Planctomycetota bacterium]
MILSLVKKINKAFRCFFFSIVLLAFLTGCDSVRTYEHTVVPRRLAVYSPWFYVSEDDIDLQESYSGFNPHTQQRFSHLTIGDKAIDMINNADKVILASTFLFDIFYSSREPQLDIVKEITSAVVQKKKNNPAVSMVLVLDPINRAYGRRIGPAVKQLLENGVDVFYSDLVSTNSATTLGIGQFGHNTLRFTDTLSFGILGKTLSLLARPKVPMQNPFDREGLSIESMWQMLALKANHRKLLVTDCSDTYEAMVSSANPHNASVPNTNFSVTVKGDIAKYIYMVIRKDVIYSKKLNMVDWSDKSGNHKKRFLTRTLPPIPQSDINISDSSPFRPVAVSFVTESCIRYRVIEMLSNVTEDDQVRIQMFYLSDFKVIDAIIDTAKRLKKPMRIILDPNKDAFGQKKDGTPNRQVAAYLMQKKKELGLNLEIRWYDTHGEQNHAKIMSITNTDSIKPKYELMNGSANWTGKNLKDINLEANICVRGSKKIVEKFNRLFDLFWENSDGMVYTVDYQGKYQAHTGMNKWRNGENWGYVTW